MRIVAEDYETVEYVANNKLHVWHCTTSCMQEYIDLLSVKLDMLVARLCKLYVTRDKVLHT